MPHDHLPLHLQLLPCIAHSMMQGYHCMSMDVSQLGLYVVAMPKIFSPCDMGSL